VSFPAEPGCPNGRTMYIVLARKYRPQTFEEVLGQAEVVRTLTSAIAGGKQAHAYLFSGPRGTGKTSMARILAKALNCEKGPTPSPCNECAQCREITVGSSLDVLEIDAASNRGIDEIRSLRENVNLRPVRARSKVYIVDEVHMMTEDAFNALLKTLEEPPEFVTFILATTAPEKIPPTIRSRCQQHFFRPLSMEVMKKALAGIAEKEGVAIAEEALERIVDFSAGAMRDCLSVLDQLIVYTSGMQIGVAEVEALLGLVEDRAVEQLLLLLRERSVDRAVALLHQLMREGKDPGLVLDGMVKKLRDVGYAVVGGGQECSGGREFFAQFASVPLERLLDALSETVEYKERLRRESLQVVLLEILFLKLVKIIGKTEQDTPRTAPEPPAPAAAHVVLEKKTPDPASPAHPESLSPFRRKAKAPPAAEDTRAGSQAPDIPFGPEEWKHLLSGVKKRSKNLEAFLKEGRPERFADGVLTVHFSVSRKFHKTSADTPEHRKIVEEVLSQMAGRPCRVALTLSDETPKKLLDQPDVREAISFFGGEIDRVEE